MGAQLERGKLEPFWFGDSRATTCKNPNRENLIAQHKIELQTENCIAAQIGTDRQSESWPLRRENENINPCCAPWLATGKWKPASKHWIRAAWWRTRVPTVANRAGTEQNNRHTKNRLARCFYLRETEEPQARMGKNEPGGMRSKSIPRRGAAHMRGPKLRPRAKTKTDAQGKRSRHPVRAGSAADRGKMVREWTREPVQEKRI
jgi:hypothetical protein